MKTYSLGNQGMQDFPAQSQLFGIVFTNMKEDAAALFFKDGYNNSYS